MADSTLNRFVASGTAAERAAFTPTPPTPASGPDQGYFWYETDTGNTYSWDGAAWDQVNTAGSVPDPIVPADGTQNITGALVVSGAVSGSNLSGTNTGDQSSIVGITGTKAQFDTACSDGNFLYVGDVTQYTDEMAQDAVGAMVDGSLTYVDATPLLQRSALTGDVTAAAGSNATTIAANAVTNAKFRQSAGLSVIGRSANTTGDVADITGAANGVLRISGTTLAFGAVDLTTAMVTGDLPFSNIAQIATDRLLGRDTAATGDIEALTVSGGIEFTGTGGIQTSAFTGDVTKTAGGTATTIANNAVSFAKFVAAPSAGIVWATGAGNYSHNASGGGTANFLRADGTWAAPGGSGTVTTTGTPASGNLTAFSGATSITNSNLSGDVTTSGTLATTIANDAVTFAKIQNSSAASKLLGRGSASGAGDFEEITLGTNLSMSGTTLNASGSGTTPTGTGFVHITAGVQDAAAKLVDTADVNDGQITLAKMANIATDRLIGRDTAATGVPEAITVGGGIEFSGAGGIQTSAFTGDVTKAAGGTATTVAAVNLGTATITGDLAYANLTPSANASRILGRTSASAGDWQECSLGVGLVFNGTVLSRSGDSVEHPYLFSTTTTAADPGVGTFRFNSATLASVTNIYIDELDADGLNIDALIGYLASGYRIYVVQDGTTANSAIFQLSGAPTDNTGWWTIPVTVVSSGTLPANSSTCVLSFILIAAGAGGSTPTGTGFRHVTAGVEDAASKLVDTADINDAQVTLAKIQNVTANRILARAAASTGVLSEVAIGPSAVLGRTASGNITSLDIGTDIDSASTTLNIKAFTGDVTKTLGGTTLTIANGVVSGAKLTANGQVRCITFIIDGGGSAITTGIKGDLEIPFACTITGWTLLLDQSGSIVIDIWKDTYANYPPTVADTITASDKPTVSATTKGQDLAPTGWTTSIAAGDTLRFNVDSITTATRAVLSIRVNVT